MKQILLIPKESTTKSSGMFARQLDERLKQLLETEPNFPEALIAKKHRTESGPYIADSEGRFLLRFEDKDNLRYTLFLLVGVVEEFHFQFFLDSLEDIKPDYGNESNGG